MAFFIDRIVLIRNFTVSGLFAFMILVSCSDGLHDCKVAEDMFTAYPAAEYCERLLEPAVHKISMRGEQIFGRCVSTDNDLTSSDASIHWQVNKTGIFSVEIRDDTTEEHRAPVMSVWLRWMGIPAA